uniref:Nuclear speckle splicing regulatory protein 1 N-terminal domain-containing protein n=1 Tax=Rhizophora mucronata TaxID=61149 RepID=A0A2P2IQR6_RHIMU
MKKYGLQLRVQPSQQKKLPPRPPLWAPPRGFGEDDEDDVEKEILRQASKNKSLQNIEEQHKKALEEDPTAFDYDGVYDEMKVNVARPRAQDREERKPKYIQTLIKKAEERQREHEIIYERRLVKERSKEDHLYENKDKFVTSAYKKKLAEQAKWMEEERLRELREEKEDVTKKTDLTDFYFNLEKNVAFGATDIEFKKKERQAESRRSEKHDDKVFGETSRSLTESSGVKESHTGGTSPAAAETSPLMATSSEPAVLKEVPDKPVSQKESSGVRHDHHKRDEDTLAAAKERFLARKRAKLQ